MSNKVKLSDVVVIEQAALVIEEWASVFAGEGRDYHAAEAIRIRDAINSFKDDALFHFPQETKRD